MRVIPGADGCRGAVEDFHLRSAEVESPRFGGGLAVTRRLVLLLEVLVHRLPFPHSSKAVSPGFSLPSPLLPDSLSTACSITMIRTVVHWGMCSPSLSNSDEQEGLAQMTKRRIVRNILWREKIKVGVFRNPSVKNLALRCTNAKCIFPDGVAWQAH